MTAAAVEENSTALIGDVELARLGEELQLASTPDERRKGIVERIQREKSKLEAAFATTPAVRGRFEYAQSLLVAEAQRQNAVAARARQAAKEAEQHARRTHAAGRPARFAALSPMRQACLVAAAAAAGGSARAGFEALGEALDLQAAGMQIPVPWNFETEHLDLSKLRELERQGLLDEAFVAEFERRELREAYTW